MTKHDNVSRERIMKATEFVKEFGWKRAKEVVSGSPALKCYFIPKYQQYFVDKHGFVYVLGMFGYFTPSLGMTMEDLTEHGFQISELKRIVESHELIKMDFESVEMAEYEYMISTSYDEPYWIRVKQAIADVEACQ